jgi:hypothetical protein
MAVGDDGLVHGARRIDVEATELAAHAGGCRQEEIFRAHRPQI